MVRTRNLLKSPAILKSELVEVFVLLAMLTTAFIAGSYVALIWVMTLSHD
jgi:hypothetical protein